MTIWEILVVVLALAAIIGYLKQDDDTNYERMLELAEMAHRHQLERQEADKVQILGGNGVISYRNDVLNPETTFPMLDMAIGYFESLKQVPNNYHDKRELIELSADQFSEAEEAVTHFSMPDFAQLASNGQFPGGDNLLLGFAPDGTPIMKTIIEMGSTGIVGGSGNGKSTFTRFLLAQLKQKGFEIFLADPEMGVGEESLADSLAGLNLDQAVCDDDEIENISQYVATEARREAKRERPLLFVVDEVTDLLEKGSPQLLDAILAVNRKGRKRNVFVWAIGQDFSAAVLDSQVRNVFTSIISFPTFSGALGRLANSSFRETVEELPMHHAAVWRPGRQVETFGVPNTTEAHIIAHFGNHGSTRLERPVLAQFPTRSGLSFNGSQNGSELHENGPEPTQNDDSERILIEQMHNDGESKTRIYESVFLGKNKMSKSDAWKIISDIIEGMKTL